MTQPAASYLVPPQPPILELRSVTKVFTDRDGAPRTAVSEVSYTVPDLPDRGEFVALVGPSGCGKSTLLNMIAGLTTPTSGSLTVKGVPVTGPGRDRGFVFQHYSSFPWRTAQGNVEFALEMAGVPRNERKARAAEALAAVGLGEAGDRYPRQLSGGMRQRLALARTLAADPPIVLMDEPFGALDVRIRIDMQDLLQRMWAERGGTVLFVTHDVGEAVYLADQVVVLSPSPGRIAEVLDVRYPHPRTRAFEKTPAYRELVDHITFKLREVARAETLPESPR